MHPRRLAKQGLPLGTATISDTASPEAGEDPPGRASRRALFADGLLSTASDASVQFVPMYLVALGASAAQVGLLSAGTGLAGLVALLPAAWLARRVASRKSVVLASAGFARLVLLAMAVLPLLVGSRAAVAVLIALGGARVLAGSLAQPSWTAVYAAVVPAQLRGIYTTRRGLAMSLTSMAAVPAAGWLIHRGGGNAGYALVFALGTGLGLAGLTCYSRIGEPPRPSGVPVGLARASRVWGDRRYHRFLLATLSLHTMASLAGPFVVVYMARSLGATPVQVGMLATSDAIAGVLGQVLTTMLVRRVPARWMFSAALVAIPTLPLIWLGISEPWQAVFPSFVGGVAWAMCHLAAFNLMLEYAPADEVAEYATAAQSVTLVAAAAGPLLGSALIARTSLDVVFAISAAGRLLALPLFLAPSPGALLAALRPMAFAPASAAGRLRHRQGPPDP